MDRRAGSCYLRTLCLALLLVVCTTAAFAQTRRLVIIKSDGLPYDLVDRLVKERDRETGKSVLPWIDHIFYQRGSRLSNFYVRGLSLSTPSWSLLETGQHLQIKGNVEFDRYTLHSYDYLNFFPLYLAGAVGMRIDMRGVEVLDSLRLPMLTDAYRHDERYVTFSLFQRGVRYSTLQSSLQNRFKKSPRELIDEWTMGIDFRSAVRDQLVRETIAHLSDPKRRYLDLYLADFDHIAHHNNDTRSQVFVLKEIDAIIGQVWTAIQQTPEAEETALVLVSDHGFNSDDKIYSQGFNLVKLLGSRQGGGHHVVTKRRLMLDYSLKGIYPLVPLITSTTSDTYYLKGQSTTYPTAMLDFDGNERASVHLRDSDLNVLHILLQQMQRRDLPAALSKATADAFFSVIERRRPEWRQNVDRFKTELKALNQAVEEQRKLWEAQPKKFSKEQQNAGLDDAAKRVYVQLDRWQNDQKEYGEYVFTLENLLRLSAEAFAPERIKISTVIPKMSMGERNSIHQLQNYVVGVAPGGLVLNNDGSLNMERSFARIDYFALLHGISVRNNVQRGITKRPVDMIAVRLDRELVLPLIDDKEIEKDVIWISAGANRQALLLSRREANGQLSLRYLPISNLTQEENGRLQFQSISWQAGLPLRIFEDLNLNIPSGDRSTWLSNWHTDTEWLEALHRTNYSNGLVGLHEELARHEYEKLSSNVPGLSEQARLMRDFTRRKRELVEADMLVVAQDHWNFDVRGFNPGGNHGSFFRIATHAVFMVAGGEKTQIPKGFEVSKPYDSLSFVPTLLAITGNLRDDNNPVPSLRERGFSHFPGRVVKELMPDRWQHESTGTP